MISTLLCLALPALAASQHQIDMKTLDPFEFPAHYVPQEYEIRLDKSFLDMTMRKVREYRPTTSLSSEWNPEGPPKQNITAVAGYWSNQYSWTGVERRLNEDFHHYAATVPGSGNYSRPIPLHFVHHRSSQDDALPLLLLHGWPSSFLEWSKVIPGLTQSTGQPFHVVAPDLPGFGFSPAPEEPGMGPREMARAFDALMHQLGYDKYGIVTTDLGWFTGMWMVSEVEKSIIGHMSDFYISPPSEDDRTRLRDNEASEEEAAYITSFDKWFGSHWLYATVHAKKPLALSAALGDSPVGLLGWFWDINRETSDGYRPSFGELITDAMMLWIPGPYANIRAYLEFFKPYVMNFPASTVPTGVSEWGWTNGPSPDIVDFAFVPQDWIKRTCNLHFFRRHPNGGHFPAVSMPQLWVQDVRDFFGKLHHAGSDRKDELRRR